MPLAVSHAFWLHSVVAEVYTANTFFFAAVLNLMVEWRQRRRWPWLAAAAAVFSMGLTNHLVLATLAPAAVAYVAANGGRRTRESCRETNWRLRRHDGFP